MNAAFDSQPGPILHPLPSLQVLHPCPKGWGGGCTLVYFCKSVKYSSWDGDNTIPKKYKKDCSVLVWVSVCVCVWVGVCVVLWRVILTATPASPGGPGSPGNPTGPCFRQKGLSRLSKDRNTFHPFIIIRSIHHMSLRLWLIIVMTTRCQYAWLQLLVDNTVGKSIGKTQEKAPAESSKSF